MNENLPNCPKCQSEHTYKDVNNFVCPMCVHEWSGNQEENTFENDNPQIKDTNGNILNDGDTVTVIKELKLKGSNSAVKVGTKVKGIRLIDDHDGHNIDCKIKGLGAIQLKSEFVKKMKP